MIDYDDSKNVMSRILEAYKLKTIKSLADKWNITASVIGSRVQRNSFPAEFVIKCSLETGADLLWVCTGQGEPGIDGVKSEIKKLELPDDILEKLERLGNLRKNDIITDEEFKILKANLI